MAPQDMLSKLREDKNALVLHMRIAHGLCENTGDIASTSKRYRKLDRRNPKAGVVSL